MFNIDNNEVNNAVPENLSGKYITTFVKILNGHFLASLTKKTGWGRNEVNDAFQNSVTYALSRIADMMLQELKEK